MDLETQYHMEGKRNIGQYDCRYLICGHNFLYLGAVVSVLTDYNKSELLQHPSHVVVIMF